MPQLKQATTDMKQFMLPSTSALPEAEQAWVKMDVGELLGGEVMDLMDDGNVNARGALSRAMLASRIKEWNFTGPDGTSDAITTENVRRMEMEDLSYLFGQFVVPKQTQLDDKKKLN